MGCGYSSPNTNDMEEDEEKTNEMKRLATMAASLEILDDPKLKRQDLRNRGLTLSALKDAFTKYELKKDELSCLDGWSPGEMLAAMVRTTTQNRKLSWAEMLDQISGGKEKSGPCDVYVIHSWNYEFSDLISSLNLFERLNFDSGGSPRVIQRKIRYFVDHFSINQHLKATQPPKDIQDVIRSCECVLLVLNPWSAPIPLNRAWCLFELMTAVEAKLRLEVTMPPKERKEFVEQKLEEKQKVFADIDSRRSQSTIQTDEEMLKKIMMEKMGGFENVDEKLKSRLNRWLLDTRLKVGHSMLEKIEQRTMELAKNRSPANRDYLAARHSLGNALQLSGHYDKALEVHCSVLQMRERILSGSHPDVLSSRSAVRLATLKKRKADRARIPT